MVVSRWQPAQPAPGRHCAKVGSLAIWIGRRAIVRAPHELAERPSRLPTFAPVPAGAGCAGCNGETTIERVFHIDRGYERIVEKLSAVGQTLGASTRPAPKHFAGSGPLLHFTA